MLAKHISFVAGHNNRGDVSPTDLQPFVRDTTETRTTIRAKMESACDGKGDPRNVPRMVLAGQPFKIGPHTLQSALTGKTRAESPDDGPEGRALEHALDGSVPLRIRPRLRCAADSPRRFRRTREASGWGETGGTTDNSGC